MATSTYKMYLTEILGYWLAGIKEASPDLTNYQDKNEIVDSCLWKIDYSSLSKSDICIRHKLRNHDLPFFLKSMNVIIHAVIVVFITNRLPARHVPRGSFYLIMFRLHIKCHKQFSNCRMAGCLHMYQRQFISLRSVYFLRESQFW